MKTNYLLTLKKILIILISFIVVYSLSGCGGDDEPTGEPRSETEVLKMIVGVWLDTDGSYNLTVTKDHISGIDEKYFYYKVVKYNNHFALELYRDYGGRIDNENFGYLIIHHLTSTELIIERIIKYTGYVDPMKSYVMAQ